GDRDVFAIQGRTGDAVVVDVYARRMGSPLDSLARLIDTSGRVIAWNDDNKDLESGLLTHAADSYLKTKLPANGRYFVQISDAQGHGGSSYKYFVRIGAPQPDFVLRITPSALNIQAGRAAVATVYAVRKDGWDGDIDLSFKDAPAGFTLSGARIPKGRDQVRITVSAGRSKPGEPLVLHLEGSAQINGKTIVRPVIPTDDMMQAFAYHHLMPARELLAMVTSWGRFTLQQNQRNDDPLHIPSGGSARLAFSIQPAMAKTQVHLELLDPPAGVTLADVKTMQRGFTLTLKADNKHAGYADNLIVEAFTEVDAKRAANGPAQKQRVSLGVLPAIPFEIIQEGSSQ
ncbi:MAG TPA: hypothetical protein VHV83_15140, partial [Armatimonadota bacterium]|nr:hypothetical protein [Armatimonadota bacterium]